MDRWDWIPDDTIMPAQYIDMHRSNASTPERQLWLAVLEDAVRCYQGGGNNDNCGKAWRLRAHRDACCWFGLCDCTRPHGEWIISFADICDLFDIDANALRKAVYTRGRQIKFARQQKVVSYRILPVRERGAEG